MEVELFYDNIKHAVQWVDSTDSSFFSYSILIEYLDEIVKNDSVNYIIKMTRMSVLFEGFYRSITESSNLKRLLTNIRINRWNNHFGTPTIIFLLTYWHQIEQTCNLFRQNTFSTTRVKKPWEVVNLKHLVIDSQNDVVIDKKSAGNVLMPVEYEQSGQFLKTCNPLGGFTTTPCDLYSQKFIAYASIVAENNGRLLEIGAAFGAATLQAISKGAAVFCNDIDPNNLAVIRNRFKQSNNYQDSVTGDDSQLILVPGSFPDELIKLPENFFDAILICRVLHFFTGDQIEKSLNQLFLYLKPGGKLFVICETPFLKNWQSFIPEYEKRVMQGMKWPGEISNPIEYENSGRITSLPKFVHWITKEVIERSLRQSSFNVEYLSYINRNGQFPQDLLLDGRESVGAIAAKPLICTEFCLPTQ